MEKEPVQETSSKIKYFVNGHGKMFISKGDAIDFAKSVGVHHSQVSMLVPQGQTSEMLRKIFSNCV